MTEKVILFGVILLAISNASAFSDSRSGYAIEIVTPQEFSDTSSKNSFDISFDVIPGNSGFQGTKENYKLVLNIYDRGMGGKYSKGGFDIYLVPEQAFISYSYGIAANDPDAEGNEPVADCGPDNLKCENVGTPVQFNGSASYDPDGAIVLYYWDFGDGTNATGAAPNHTYSAYKWNGTGYESFIADLMVTDASGLTNKSSQKVVLWMAGDVNGDGKVNILDASVIGLKWNGNDACADLNNDGSVNILDASIIGLNWGKLAIIGSKVEKI